MPVYEYQCQACQAKFVALVGMIADPDDERCPKCQSSDTKKLVSRVARYRTEEQRLDEMADRLEGVEEPESPTELRSLVREMGKAMDDDASDELEEIFESEEVE